MRYYWYYIFSLFALSSSSDKVVKRRIPMNKRLHCGWYLWSAQPYSGVFMIVVDLYVHAVEFWWFMFHERIQMKHINVRICGGWGLGVLYDLYGFLMGLGMAAAWISKAWETMPLAGLRFCVADFVTVTVGAAKRRIEIEGIAESKLKKDSKKVCFIYLKKMFERFWSIKSQKASKTERSSN